MNRSVNVSENKKSLVLITVDCLRADHCGFNGYRRPTTPFLDALASESFVVPTAIVAGAPTYYSLPAIFASRTPLALGRDIVGLAPGEETMATVLHSAGYATAAFTAANPYISSRFGYDQGFEVFRDFAEFDSPTIDTTEQTLPGATSGPGKLNAWVKKAAVSAGLRKIYDELYFQYCLRIAAPSVGSIETLQRFPPAHVVVESAEAWLASVGSRPFFLWIHLMDPHSPYYPPADAYQTLTGRELTPSRARYLNEFWNRSNLNDSGFGRHKQAVIDLYDAGIRWVDVQIARLVGALKQMRRWDDCVFSLTADHGEEFLEHGRRFHAPVSMVDEIQHVPLLFRVPGSFKATLPSHPFSHLHLAPTLLDTLGVPAPSSFQGTSQWERLEQSGQSGDPVHPVISECVYGCTNPFRVETRMGSRLLSVRDARHKLVIRLEAGAAEDIYDLQADPAEQRPLSAGSVPDLRTRLLQIAQRHIEKSVADSDTEARLRARLRDIRLELTA